jgi:hypothetical protein
MSDLPIADYALLSDCTSAALVNLQPHRPCERVMGDRRGRQEGWSWLGRLTQS